jgi:hypothetical protein
MPGSAESFPGESGSPAAGFASGKPLDTAPGCATLGLFLEDLAGDDDRYAGASDDELQGVICGWERAEAAMADGKHAAVAELIRRRPAGAGGAVGRALRERWAGRTEAASGPGAGRGSAGQRLGEGTAQGPGWTATWTRCALDLADRPGEMGGIGPVDPDPGANTQDRYQIRASADPGYLTHQRTGLLSPQGRSLVCVTSADSRHLCPAWSSAACAMP